MFFISAKESQLHASIDFCLGTSEKQPIRYCLSYLVDCSALFYAGSRFLHLYKWNVLECANMKLCHGTNVTWFIPKGYMIVWDVSRSSHLCYMNSSILFQIVLFFSELILFVDDNHQDSHLFYFSFQNTIWNVWHIIYDLVMHKCCDRYSTRWFTSRRWAVLSSKKNII